MPGPTTLEGLLPQEWQHLLSEARQLGRRKARLSGQDDVQGEDSAASLLYECWREHPDWMSRQQILAFVKKGLSELWPRPEKMQRSDIHRLRQGAGTANEAGSATDGTSEEPTEVDEVSLLVAALAQGDPEARRLLDKINQATDNGKELTAEHRARFQNLVRLCVRRRWKDQGKRARPRDAYRRSAPGYIGVRASYAYHDRIVEVRERLRLFYEVLRQLFPTRQTLARAVKEIHSASPPRSRQRGRPARQADLQTTVTLLQKVARGERFRWPRSIVLPARTVLLLAALGANKLAMLPRGAMSDRTQFEIAALLHGTKRTGGIGRKLAVRARAVLARLPRHAVRGTTIVGLAAILQPPRFVVVQPPEGGRPPRGGRRAPDVLVRRVLAHCRDYDLFRIWNGGRDEQDWRFWAMEWAARVRTARQRAAGTPVAAEDPDLMQLALDQEMQRQRASELEAAHFAKDDFRLDLVDRTLTDKLYEPRAGALIAAASVCGRIFDRSASDCRKAELTSQLHAEDLRAHATHPVGAALLPFSPPSRLRRRKR